MPQTAPNVGIPAQSHPLANSPKKDCASWIRGTCWPPPEFRELQKAWNFDGPEVSIDLEGLGGKG